MKMRIGLLLVLSFALTLSVNAQDKSIKLPPNWYNLDFAQSGYFGISTEKAYNEVLKGKVPKQKVIVAVIDGGTDLQHQDLKDALWTNNKEIPGNGIDDDNNGYIDDIHGWNFLGSKNGTLAYDNLELVRIMRKYESKYRSVIKTTVLDSTEKEEFAIYQKARGDFGKKYDEASSAFPIYILIKKVMDSVAFINKKNIPSLEDMDKYIPDDETEEYVKKIIRKGAKDEGGIDKFYTTIKKGHHELETMLKYNLNIKYDERSILVGDDYSDSYQRNYGNSDLAGPNADHGTHVSGIIGAIRNNGLGIEGVANDVRIMTIRVVPEGDERDKDVANGIRYAVDNGAKVINMSFGKGYKWDKKAVDEAVKYAESKDVLLVHAAGNDNSDNDRVENYPNKFFESPEAEAYFKSNKPLTPQQTTDLNIQKGKQINNMTMKPDLWAKPTTVDTLKFKLPHAKNWIEVGASAYKDDEELKASFSNYGKFSVDVFAPGVKINSTVPNSKYEEFDGTSMAAPVVSGLAALLLTYYPELKPSELRDIIIRSVSKVNHKIKYKNEKGENIRVPFSELCVSGGIVNAYNALKMAHNYKLVK